MGMLTFNRSNTPVVNGKCNDELTLASPVNLFALPREPNADIKPGRRRRVESVE